ncbi:hypothetical protein [Paraburkholderia tropica]|uniref:hypothetical protein n=1 Tax=Paraburkholderia tropica TaxID=92647 RepID=UPI002AB63350|nr:hypothetical protein [Paraburkholderia tropica]
MVYILFCVSGALGKLCRHSPVTIREGEVAVTRSLERDALLLANTLKARPGAVVVVGNDWPFSYDLEMVRHESHPFGQRVVNMVNTIGSTKEEAVLDFMEGRREPFVILASGDYEFSELTVDQRVDVDHRSGLDEAACLQFEKKLQVVNEEIMRPLSDDEVLRAGASRSALRRARRYIAPLRAAEDLQFQRSLCSLMGGR